MGFLFLDRGKGFKGNFVAQKGRKITGGHAKDRAEARFELAQDDPDNVSCDFRAECRTG